MFTGRYGTPITMTDVSLGILLSILVIIISATLVFLFMYLIIKWLDRWL